MQDDKHSAENKSLGPPVMGNRIIFAKLPDIKLPIADRTSGVFLLGFVFGTFGLASGKARAIRLLVGCTNIVKQREIV